MELTITHPFRSFLSDPTWRLSLRGVTTAQMYWINLVLQHSDICMSIYLFILKMEKKHVQGCKLQCSVI
jgi:hypothetical protein